jgi:hypothetical protein
VLLVKFLNILVF